MEGVVTAYADDSLTLSVDRMGGSGTKADWTINLTGQPSIGRERLTANRTYYVATTGSDTNDGLTSGAAFATLQKAYNIVSALDLSGMTVTIQVAAGTYSSGVSATTPQVGAGSICFVGDTTTPSNVLVSTTNANCFSASGPSVIIYVAGFKLVAATSGRGLFATNNGVININGAMEFGACATHHIIASSFGLVNCSSGAITISGGSVDFVNAQQQGTIVLQGTTVTLTGTPAFSSAFANSALLGMLSLALMTFSGSATGKRYSATSNSVIYTAGGGSTYFPGSTDGTTATGGQYV
jgi:hypothetical protein